MKMRKTSYIFLLMWCRNTMCGWGGTSKKEQDIMDFYDNQKSEHLAAVKEKSELDDHNKILNDKNNRLNIEIDNKETKIKELDTEIESKDSLKESILNVIIVAEKRSILIKNENEKLETAKNKLASEIEEMKTKWKELNGDIEMLSDKTKQITTEILTQEIQTKELTKEIETKSIVKESILSDISVQKSKEWDLQKGNEKIQNEIDAKTKSYNSITELIKQGKIEKTNLDDAIATLKEEKVKMKNGNRKEQTEICKEHYTFWNFELLSNNKESVFASFLTTVLISAYLPFLLGIVTVVTSTSTSSDISTSKQKIVQKQSQPRLEHMSDDEESNEMVPSSSVLLNRDIKYNYDREAMEKNEDPSGCFDFIRRRYKIKENLRSHWQNLKHGKFVYLNLWKVANGELTLTKILLKKVLKADTPLLTFELFQTKLSDGSSYSDCVETELDEEDDRIEAKLAMKIFYKLPEFSV